MRGDGSEGGARWGRAGPAPRCVVSTQVRSGHQTHDGMWAIVQLCNTQVHIGHWGVGARTALHGKRDQVARRVDDPPARVAHRRPHQPRVVAVEQQRRARPRRQGRRVQRELNGGGRARRQLRVYREDRAACRQLPGRGEVARGEGDVGEGGEPAGGAGRGPEAGAVEEELDQRQVREHLDVERLVPVQRMRVPGLCSSAGRFGVSGGPLDLVHFAAHTPHTVFFTLPHGAFVRRSKLNPRETKRHPKRLPALGHRATAVAHAWETRTTWRGGRVGRPVSLLGTAASHRLRYLFTGPFKLCEGAPSRFPFLCFASRTTHAHMRALSTCRETDRS